VERAFLETARLGALHRRNAMLDAVAYAATRIVASSDWRQHINDLLEHLGKVLDNVLGLNPSASATCAARG
jgi:hypothetical protein